MEKAVLSDGPEMIAACICFDWRQSREIEFSMQNDLRL